MDGFLLWVSRHSAQASQLASTGNAVTEVDVVADMLDGKKREDIPNPAIFTEFRFDQDAEMEHGAKFFHEDKVEDPTTELHAVAPLLQSLLMLKTPAVTALAQSMISATWNPKKYDSKPPIADTRRHFRYCSSQNHLKQEQNKLNKLSFNKLLLKRCCRPFPCPQRPECVIADIAAHSITSKAEAK